MQNTNDNIQKFIFEQADIRGQTVKLEQSYQDILQQHYYPPPIQTLFGEFLAATILLASTIKYDGRLVLQARGVGDISLLMAECTHDNIVRGLVRYSNEKLSGSFKDIFAQATLVITIEPLKGENYQGIVAMDGDNLAECLEAYFMQSEQLSTFIRLTATNQQAAGFLLQQLPKNLVDDSDQRNNDWQHATQLAQTIKDEELLSLDAENLLFRLYHQDKVRVFSGETIEYRCSCSQQRTEQALKTVARDELNAILKEDGEVTMNCEFCNHTYRFDQSAIDNLFS